MTATDRKYYTIGGLRVHFGRSIGRDRIYKLIDAGHLRAIVINGRRVIPAEELDRFDRLLRSSEPVTLRDRNGDILVSTGGKR